MKITRSVFGHALGILHIAPKFAACARCLIVLSDIACGLVYIDLTEQCTTRRARSTSNYLSILIDGLSDESPRVPL